LARCLAFRPRLSGIGVWGLMLKAETIDIEIDRADVCPYLGYRSGDTPSAGIASMINECIAKSFPLIQPAFTYVLRDVKSIVDGVSFLDDGSSIQSHIIARLLGHCEKVAVYVLTVGSQLEEMGSALAEDGFILESYVLDSIGSSATEKLAEAVQQRIAADAAAQRLCISRRFSPGYCDWHISQQSTIFQLVDGDSVGIHLTPDCLMVPRKSSSGIVGIGRCDGYVETYNPCLTCKKTRCPGRR
jgi:hypothetical protein